MKVLNDLRARKVACRGEFGRAASPGKVGFVFRFIGKRFRNRLRLGDEGNSLVEFALILPPLVMLLTGILSFGSAFMNYESLTHGATMGADYLVAMRTTTKDPCADVLNQIAANAPTLDQTKIGITLTTSGGGSASGSSCKGSQSIMAPTQTITVKATYPCNIGVYGVSLTNFLLTATLTEYEF